MPDPMTPSPDTTDVHLRDRRADDTLTRGQRRTSHLLREAARIVGAANLPAEYRADAFRIVASDLIRPIR